jgi:hypothetical protein
MGSIALRGERESKEQCFFITQEGESGNGFFDCGWRDFRDDGCSDGKPLEVAQILGLYLKLYSYSSVISVRSVVHLLLGLGSGKERRADEMENGGVQEDDSYLFAGAGQRLLPGQDHQSLGLHHRGENP